MQTCASSQATWSPHWAIRQLRATVLMATVLPPVLGPVITTPSTPSPMENCKGTQTFLSISGCLAFRRQMRLSATIFGSLPSYCSESFPLEKIKSSFSIIRMFVSMTALFSAT